MKDSQREYGVIEGVRSGNEDGRCISAWLFHHGPLGTQGFGGYSLGHLLPEWERELCELFGVAKFVDIDGKYCWALRSFSGWNEPIEGLEVDGKRFTATDFFRRHLVKPVSSPLEKRREALESEINHHTRRINDEAKALARLEADYVDWSGPLASHDTKTGGTP